ncbi:hypothetical protein [Amycolatopsis sp. NPDC051371]|uniref:hypothetical protein n=1 Tax=Amycolatopsis sp. NPDC051371 TaxID=3155800 RepID=UPI003417E7D6
MAALVDFPAESGSNAESKTVFCALVTLLTLFTVVPATAHAAPDRSVGVFREVPAGVPLTKSLDLRKLPATMPQAQQVRTSALDQNIPTPVTFGECHKDIRAGYWTKNRFAGCTITDMAYQRYACPEAGCAVTGTTAPTCAATLPGC